MSNWFIDSDEEVVTETDQMLRDREIRSRLTAARRAETVDAMKERYKNYDRPQV